MLRKVIEVRSNVLGSEHPDTLRSCNSPRQRPSGREASIPRRKRIFVNSSSGKKGLLGPEHPDTLFQPPTALAITLDLEGKYAEAEAQFSGLIRTEERVMGAEHPQTLRKPDGAGDYALRARQIPRGGITICRANQDRRESTRS